MLKKNISKIKWHAAWFLLPILLFFNPLFASSNGEEWLDQPVSLKFHEEPRDKVLEIISKQTGIAILYDQELANEKVTGNYKDVKVSDAITRLFSSKNKSIQVSKDKKVIVVKTFGAKNFIWAGTGQGAQAKDQDFAGSMTNAELEKLHAQQYKEYKNRIADDNEILDGGMTRREIRVMQEQQAREIKQMLNDPELVDPFTGMTNSETRRLHASQYDEIQEQEKSGDTVDPFTGITSAETRRLHEKQLKQFRTENKVDPFTGQTVEEINELHKKQAHELKLKK